MKDISPIIAGIDEAGYGPFYGPLCVGCAVVSITDADIKDFEKLPNLWDTWDKAICKTPDEARKKHLLAIGDSKKLTSKGPYHLEMGVGSWLQNLERTAENETQLIEQLLAKNTTSFHPVKTPWYGPALTRDWPRQADSGLLRIQGNAFNKAIAPTVAKPLGLKVRCLDEVAFNASLAKGASKSTTTEQLIVQHVQLLWRMTPRPIHLVIDRQGGRQRYGTLMAQWIPGATVSTILESVERSSYCLHNGDKKLHITFTTKAENKCLPVAMAAMAAKLTRELFMERFNRYFHDIAPKVAPTAGYGADANRWCDEISPWLHKAGIAPAQLRRIK